MNKGRLLQVTAGFFALMVCFTVLSRAADQKSIAVVRTDRPQNKMIEHAVRASGKVVQNQDLAVTTEPDQRVTAIYVREGERVSRGDPLFEVDLTLLDEKILNQEQEMEKQKLQIGDVKSQKEVSAQQKANSQAQAQEQYSLSTGRAGVQVSRAKKQLAQAKQKLKEFQKECGQKQEDSEVGEALEQALEEKTNAYLAAQQELRALEWEIENAVYTAKQNAAVSASLVKENMAFTGEAYVIDEESAGADPPDPMQISAVSEGEWDAGTGEDPPDPMQISVVSEGEWDAGTGEDPPDSMQISVVSEGEWDAEAGADLPDPMQISVVGEGEWDAGTGEDPNAPVQISAINEDTWDAEAVQGTTGPDGGSGNGIDVQMQPDPGSVPPGESFGIDSIVDVTGDTGENIPVDGNDPGSGAGDMPAAGRTEPDSFAAADPIGSGDTAAMDPTGSGSAVSTDQTDSDGIADDLLLPEEAGTGVPETDQTVTEEELARIEASVRDNYRERLEAARKKAEEAGEEKAAAEAALVQYQQEFADRSDAQNAETAKQLLAEVQAAQQAYEDAAIAANEAAVTSGRAVQTAGIADPSNSSDRINEISYEQMELALKKLEDLKKAGGKVRAGADGLITKINIMTGEKTSDTTAVLMADLSRGYRFTADITEEQQKYIGTGDLVSLTSGDGKQRLEELPVDSVMEDEETKGIYHVTVQLPEESFEIGTNVTMEFSRKSEAYPVTVPLSALHLDERQQPYVLVAEEFASVMGTENRARKVNVTVLEKNESYAALAEGVLDTQQEIIVSSDKAVDQGSRIRVET